MHSAYAATALPVVLLSPEEMPAEFEADRLVGQKNRDIVGTGDAILRQDGKTIRADKLRYTPAQREVDAEGGVVLQQQGDVMSGPHLHMDMDTGRGAMEQPQFLIQENHARATAANMDILDKQHYNLSNATYTTCPAGNDDWQLNMSTLELDRVNEVGTAYGAWVAFQGVPFVYAPWLDFPLNDHRKSGFLAAINGNSTKGGFELTLPYYWNIAPNADATFSPRVMVKRGVQLNNEFRYMGAGVSGEIHADILPNDLVTKRNRARLSLKHNEVIVSGIQGFVNFNRVTDDAYFRDLSTTVNSSAQVNLLQEGGVNLSADGWNSTVRVQRYQTLQDPLALIAVPYARLPQITTSAAKIVADSNLAMKAEYVEFSHPTAVNGRRLVLNPSASYPLVNEAAFYVTPKLALHSTHYVMGANNAAAVPNAARTLPLFSLDSGVAFERDAQFFGNDFLQTLEPRAFYVYVPYRNQSLLPSFDTAQADFSFTQMFTENRFFGSDRIGDANQLTLATTTRVLSPSNGAERFKFTLGERFSFTAPQVTLFTPNVSSARSDILLAVGGRMSKALLLDSEMDFDPNQSKTQRYSWQARYRPEPGKTLNFGYRFLRGTMRQTDVSAQWPLSQRWSSVAQMNYSFQDQRIVNSIAGLEYNESCWTLRLIGQHYTTATRQSNTGIFVQLELNDLMQVGSDPLAILKQYVPGYTKLNTPTAPSGVQTTP